MTGWSVTSGWDGIGLIDNVELLEPGFCRISPVFVRFVCCCDSLANSTKASLNDTFPKDVFGIADSESAELRDESLWESRPRF